MAKFPLKKYGKGSEPEKGSPFRNWSRENFKKLIHYAKKIDEKIEEERIKKL